MLVPPPVHSESCTWRLVAVHDVFLPEILIGDAEVAVDIVWAGPLQARCTCCHVTNCIKALKLLEWIIGHVSAITLTVTVSTELYL